MRYPPVIQHADWQDAPTKVQIHREPPDCVLLQFNILPTSWSVTAFKDFQLFDFEFKHLRNGMQ